MVGSWSSFLGYNNCGFYSSFSSGSSTLFSKIKVVVQIEYQTLIKNVKSIANICPARKHHIEC